MKYYTKLKQYKASNLIYDLEQEIGYSYEWYQIAKRINGVMYVNTYSYSPTTVKHYYKIMRLFNDLSIDYRVIRAPKGLQNLEEAKIYYLHLIDNVKNELSNPRCRKSLIPFREQELIVLERQLEGINHEL